jgi:uncharacterized protein
MAFPSPPPSAAWRHGDAREGFEVVFVRPDPDGYRFQGTTAAVEGGQPWVVDYEIAITAGWVTRAAVISGRSPSGAHELRLEAQEPGSWRINGSPASHLDGCLDVDLESSALTNAFPARRLGLQSGQEADAPAVYVRALNLEVERLEQRYVRLSDERGLEHYHYAAPRFDFECRLAYDPSGLIADYPGIAVRSA